MSFQDTAFIFFIALLLFGPKKLPELARYVGKLMGEFRRASNEFRMQMEDELRLSEQADQQKKIAAMEAAAPVAPLLDLPEPEHPHMPSAQLAVEPEPSAEPTPEHHIDARPAEFDPAPASAFEPATAPLPIATSGELSMMPPATGLPIARTNGASSASSLAGAFDSIPHISTAVPASTAEPETSTHA